MTETEKDKCIKSLIVESSVLYGISACMKDIGNETIATRLLDASNRIYEVSQVFEAKVQASEFGKAE